MRNAWSVLHKYLDRLSVPGNGKNRLQRYGFVIILSVIFFSIKTTLAALLGKDIPFLFALFVVILSAWFGGFRPGLFATGLTGFLTYYFFLDPKYTLFGKENIPNVVILLTFFLEGFSISALSESHRKSDIQRSEFLGVISHELKNPLTSIKGYAEMIKKIASTRGESRLADFAERIDRQSKQLTLMINEMLDITKIETGRLTYQDEVFDITELTQEIINDQQVTTETHKISFKGDGKELMTGDRYRIGQVLTNLINNAIKYSPQAKKVLVQVANKQSGIVISVQDFGPGIAKEDQTKLFSPFFRADSTKSTKGTGIGLFISHQIVQRHKGKLWVKSTKGVGSTFSLWLPKKKQRY